MKFVLGVKENMTQIFDEAGHARPATVLRVEPHKVTQVRTGEKDGYEAVQLATVAQKESRLPKSLAVHLGGGYRFVKEFRPTDAEKAAIADVKVGDLRDVSVFAPGDMVTVAAISKGKGFQGVVKRHGFHGGRASHGQKHSLREPGAIGGGGRAGGRVIKGMRMAGRMGGERITVKNLKVLQVNPSEHLIVIAGAVPGRRGTVVEVRGQ